MDAIDENKFGEGKPLGLRGHTMGGGGKFGVTLASNRQPLRDIKNLVGGGLPRSNATSGKEARRNFAETLKSSQKPSLPVIIHNDQAKGEVSISLNDHSPIKDSTIQIIKEIEEMFKAGDLETDESSVDLEADESGIDLEADESSVDLEADESSVDHETDENRVDLDIDIDMDDADDPLAVVEYVKDIYAFYRESEVSSCVNPIYMSNQTDINEKMRAILIDWLIEVHYKFDLMEETLFLMVNIIDRYLSCQTVTRKTLQLVGVTAMLLACKYEEVSVPIMEDLIIITDRAYTRQDILEMERQMANALEFNMSVPTPYIFVRRFLKAAASDKHMELLSLFMVELCLVEYEMLRFPPSLIAAAAVYTAQCSIRGFQLWTRVSELCSSYSEDHLLECARKMVGFHQGAATGKFTSVQRKYSTSKYGYAARSEPASFLLESG